MIRSFIAIELPDEIRRALGGVQGQLKRDLVGVRWVHPGSVHLTLKFLGEIHPEQVQPIAAAAKGVVQDEPPLNLGVSGLGAFPNPRRPRVIWVGLQGDVERLGGLQARLEEALEPLGFPAEHRPFRPHLTLGRVKDPRRPPDLTRALADVTVPICNSFDVHEILVYKSDLRPNGAIYTKLQHLPFAGSAGS
ncbi:MAG TPA: RNA 2',3'-cyclic phosphodiesterase [Syntrophobacteria bacterium]|nr:RNA 2',3'-cyclic phosphodiesterase [Syntrophobacteria bacterium]